MKVVAYVKPRLHVYYHFLQSAEMQVPLKLSKAFENGRKGATAYCSVVVNV